ncbi:nicotinate-nucleotide adenylyltransferase [Acetivibrio cellulolyticus]|uniref:nicotinate-nucleotide adenylyltransferase n=1 Tax=Acetivibrio cellulolyticus TaxID=35830 RepID=UPI0001E30578|nr:nicotinate-nucleotide adenylyltransferase [Acetivibrio cellulolyticus]
MEDNAKKIGISGGTFNPIHYGHLIVAEMVRDRFGLEKVLFIPSGMPPHKNLSNVASAEHRFNMVQQAVKDNPYFVESRIEVERGGYTYTIDTLKNLSEIYGKSARLYYIIGADVLNDLLTWRNYQDVFNICEFIAVLRPGNDSEGFNKQMEYLRDTFSARIHFIDTPLIEISSTEIRNRIKGGRSIKYLVPDTVEAYIKENKLYID